MEVKQQPTQALASRVYTLPWSALVFSLMIILSLLGSIVRSHLNPFPQSEFVNDVLANPAVQRLAAWDFPLAASSAITGPLAQTAAGYFPVFSTWSSFFAASDVYHFFFTVMRADLTCTIFSNFTVFLAFLTLAGWSYNALTHSYYRWDRNASPQLAPNLPLLLPPSPHPAHLPPSRDNFSFATALFGRVPGYSARRKISVDDLGTLKAYRAQRVPYSSE